MDKPTTPEPPSVLKLLWPIDLVPCLWLYLFLILHPLPGSVLYTASLLMILLLSGVILLVTIFGVFAKDTWAKQRHGLPFLMGGLLLWQGYAFLGWYIIVVTLLNRAAEILRIIRPAKVPDNIVSFAPAPTE